MIQSNLQHNALCSHSSSSVSPSSPDSPPLSLCLSLWLCSCYRYSPCSCCQSCLPFRCLSRCCQCPYLFQVKERKREREGGKGGRREREERENKRDKQKENNDNTQQSKRERTTTTRSNTQQHAATRSNTQRIHITTRIPRSSGGTPSIDLLFTSFFNTFSQWRSSLSLSLSLLSSFSSNSIVCSSSTKTY